MVDAAAAERVDQRAAHMLLADELGEFLRTPFARERGVAHVCPGLRTRREAARTSLSSGTRHRRCRCCLPALTGFTTGRRGETDAGHHRKGHRCYHTPWTWPRTRAPCGVCLHTNLQQTGTIRLAPSSRQDAVRCMNSEVSSQVPATVASKVPAVTLGETGGDTLSMTLGLGYLTSTLIFATALVILVAFQVAAKTFRPFLYWATIIASTTAG